MTNNGPDAETNGGECYCLRCGYELTHTSGSSCSECGQVFDRDDRRTYGISPRSGARQRTLSRFFASLLTIIALSFLVEMIVMFLGWDPLMAFLLSLATLPLMIPLVFMALIPSLDASPQTRVLAVVLPILILLTTWPVFPGITIPTANWPFRLSFFLHRPALERLATEIRATGTTPDAARVGVLSFIDVRFLEPEDPMASTLGLQISGDGGGGVHLVQTRPNARFVWLNTNWEIDLGDGWHLVYQD